MTTMKTITVEAVDAETYRNLLYVAQNLDARIAEATTPVAALDLPAGTRTFVTADGLSGFAVKADGELVGVFSRVKGRGDALVAAAVAAGASFLDCFDGYLPGFYARHGFRETGRAANWTPGQPDVVFMSR